MSLSSIKASIVNALDTISGLKVYDHDPGTVEELPAGGGSLDGANYTVTVFVLLISVS